MAKRPVAKVEDDKPKAPEIVSDVEDLEGEEPSLPASADDDELAAATAELEADQAEPEVDEGGKPAAAPAEDPPAEGEGDDGAQAGTVPHQALHEERKRRQELEGMLPMLPAMNQQLQAVTNALAELAKRQAVAGSQAPAPDEGKVEPSPVPEPNIDEQIATYRDDLLASAKKYDDDEISLQQHEQTRALVDDNIFKLQLGLTVAAVGDVVKTELDKRPAVDMTLSRETAKLEKEFPASRYVNQDETDALVPIAVQRLIDNGRTVDNEDPESHLMVRRETARLVQAMYGYRVPKEEQVVTTDGDTPAASEPTPATGDKPAQQPIADGNQPPPAGNRPLSPQALATKRKLEEATRQPPNIAQLGDASPSGGIENLDEPTIMGMNEDDLLGLPQEVLNRIETHGAS